MFELIATFGWLWWVMMLVGSGVIMWFLSDTDDIDDEQTRTLVGGTATTVIVLLIWVIAGDIRPWHWNVSWHWATYVGEYIIAGVVWACFYWIVPFGRKCERQFYAVRDGWLARQGFPPGQVPSEFKNKFRDYLIAYTSKNAYPYRLPTGKLGADLRPVFEPVSWPLAKNHKARWTAWAIWWPWSIVNYVALDLLRHLYSSIFQLLSGSMDYFIKLRFNKTKVDFEQVQDTDTKKGDEHVAS